jgi:heat shock protein HtpX
MLGTVGIIIAVSTLGLSFILGSVGQLNVYTLIASVIIFNVLQWLLAPYMINWMYKARPLSTDETPDLYRIIEDLSYKSGIDTPKLMLSGLKIPNAFAYGSPLTGSHVAITQGLLDHLEEEEVEAIIGHELGHIKHRDVQVMMFVSLLPSLFYILARSLAFESYYNSRNRRSSNLGAISGVVMLVYFLLTLFNLNLSRLREYYADQHSASIVKDGARKLSEGLAKIATSTSRIQRTRSVNVSGFKALFITDPDKATRDSSELHGWMTTDEALVDRVAGRNISGMESFMEIFSTHPNIVKRLKTLRKLK